MAIRITNSGNAEKHKNFKKEGKIIMKGKKLLAGMLSAAMVFGTMAVPVFADNNTATVKDTDELRYAINSADVTEIIVEGDVSVGDVNFDGKNGITIKGDPSDGEDTLVFDAKQYKTVSINFSNLTLAWKNANYCGFIHASNLTYNNCKITGQPFLYGENETFNNCEFVQDSETSYNLWTYGAKNVNFNNCTFNSAGKSVLIYNEGALIDGKVNFVNCNINASQAVGKAAIEVDSSYSNFEVNIDSSTTATGFSEGTTSGNSLYNVKLYKNVTNADGSKSLNTKIILDGDVIVPLTDSLIKSEFGDCVAQIGDKYYKTLADAVAASQSGDTIKLLCDAHGDGIIFKSGKNVTVDFGGYTYTHDGVLVGSKGYESQMFQLLKDSNITFKNGKVTSAIAGIGIQNYSNLTLEDMTVELTTPTSAFGMAYTVSNNNGDTVLTGNTNIIASKNCTKNCYAFDVYNRNASVYPSVNVTLDENMTGTIDGDIELSNDDASPVKELSDFKLEIRNGNINGKIVSHFNGAQASSNNPVGQIYGGTFSERVPANMCAPGYSAKLVNGKYVVDDSADEIKVEFENAGQPNVYNIVLKAQDSQTINRLSTADLTFKFDVKATDKMTYKVAAGSAISVSNPDNANADRYEFHFDGVTQPDSGKKAEVTIGTVTFGGYGTFDFGVADASTNIVHTARTSDNIVWNMLKTAVQEKVFSM